MSRPLEATPTLNAEESERLMKDLTENMCSREEAERRIAKAKQDLARVLQKPEPLPHADPVRGGLDFQAFVNYLVLLLNSEDSTSRGVPEYVGELRRAVAPVVAATSIKRVNTELERCFPKVLAALKQFPMFEGELTQVPQIHEDAPMARGLVRSDLDRLMQAFELAPALIEAVRRLGDDVNRGTVSEPVTLALACTPDILYTDRPAPLRLVSSYIEQRKGVTAFSVLCASDADTPGWMAKTLVDQVVRSMSECAWLMATLGYLSSDTLQEPPGSLSELFLEAAMNKVSFGPLKVQEPQRRYQLVSDAAAIFGALAAAVGFVCFLFGSSWEAIVSVTLLLAFAIAYFWRYQR